MTILPVRILALAACLPLLTLLPAESANAKACKKYRSCAEVIADFPDGKFGRKDKDKDGIPCENVCSSRQQVKDLLKKAR